MQSLAARLDRITAEVIATRDIMADLAARFRNVEAKLADLETAVQTIPAPPPPDPVSGISGSFPAGGTEQSDPLSAAGNMSGGKAGPFAQRMREN